MKSKTGRKRVVIALRMAGVAGQEKLAGIFRRLGNDHNWDITLLRTAQECTADRIAAAIADGYDGFIVSIPSGKPFSSSTPITCCQSTAYCISADPCHPTASNSAATCHHAAASHPAAPSNSAASNSAATCHHAAASHPAAPSNSAATCHPAAPGNAGSSGLCGHSIDPGNSSFFSLPRTPGVSSDVYAPLAGCDIPTVVLDIHVDSLAARTHNIVFVRNSADAIGQAAADHLLSTGRCRSYAFVHNPAVVEWSVERFRAFRETLADRDLWCHELNSLEQLRRLERPVGICAANDDCGYDVLEWCRSHRLRVPDDALVVGINNDTLICENSRPRLSSVQPDFELEGFLAADALESLMTSAAQGVPTERSASRDLLVGVKTVVRRDSTAETSPSGKLVQRAVAYIRRNALKGIGAADVVRHLGCSRRLADLRFRELQGTSIGEMLITTRLDEVKRLLRATKEPIDTIAGECGFANPNYLKNLFKKRFNMTMREYRRSV